MTIAAETNWYPHLLLIPANRFFFYKKYFQVLWTYGNDFILDPIKPEAHLFLFNFRINLLSSNTMRSLKIEVLTLIDILIMIKLQMQKPLFVELNQ